MIGPHSSVAINDTNKNYKRDSFGNSEKCYSNIYSEMSQRMTNPTKWHVRPAKTQISLGMRPV